MGKNIWAKVTIFFTNLRQKSGIDRLEPREKWVLLGGLGFVVFFLLGQLVIMPFFNARANLESAIIRKQAELVKIAELREEYLAFKQEEGGIQAGVEGRSVDFSLFTFLDRESEKSGVKKQITSMKPSLIEGDGALDEVQVEMNIQQISLEDLVNFVLLVESSENVVFVRRISIQDSGQEQGFLDAVMQIVTFEKKG